MHLKTPFSCQSFAWLALCLLFCNGCGSSNPAGRVPISGEVTLDGTPCDTGTIEFSPVTGKLGSGAKIMAGKYSLPLEKGLPPGEYVVRITSPSVPVTPAQSASKIPGMESDDVHLGKERVHARYNSKSELKVVVPADTTAFSKEFAVTSR